MEKAQRGQHTTKCVGGGGKNEKPGCGQIVGEVPTQGRPEGEKERFWGSASRLKKKARPVGEKTLPGDD